ncbi:hypothetical protein MMC32_001336 [Xylographa parallela]|nr:hypothetical protein [Xylographa parallela]
MPPLDLPAFISAWTALYAHLDAIGYLPPSSVSYPPYGTLASFSTTAPVPLHPLILSLLPRLPYPSSYESALSFELIPRARAQPYTVEGQLRLARDPEMEYLDGEPRLGPGQPEEVAGVLREEEVALTTQLAGGTTLVLDVVQGTLREYSVSNPPPGAESQYPFPHDPSDRRNWPALPAVETVRSYVAKYESLEWIAWRAGVEDGVIEAHDYRVSAASSFSRLGEPSEARRRNGLGKYEREWKASG